MAMAAMTKQEDAHFCMDTLARLPVAQAAFGALLAVELSKCTGQAAQSRIGAAVRAAVSADWLQRSGAKAEAAVEVDPSDGGPCH